MAFADSGESIISIVAETVFGTTPATPAFRNLLITSESLSLTRNRQVDPSVRGTPRITGKKGTSQQVSGQISGILRSGAEIDLLLEWALRGAFATNVLKAAAEFKSLTIERQHKVGATTHYFRFTGCRCQQFALSVNTDGFLTFTADVLGIGHAAPATTIITGATYAAPTNPGATMAAPDVVSLASTGLTTQPSARNLAVTINNNAAAQPKIGQLAPAGIRYGDQNVTGSFEAYFEDVELYNRFISQTDGDLSFTADDGTGSYAFVLPKITPDSSSVPIPGNNQDIVVPFAFEALNDTVSGTHIQITRA